MLGINPKSCQKRELVTKAEAKDEFLMTEKQLAQLNYVTKPWYNKTCVLYLRPQVEDLAILKWGSERALSAERERRRTNREAVLISEDVTKSASSEFLSQRRTAAAEESTLSSSTATVIVSPTSAVTANVLSIDAEFGLGNGNFGPSVSTNESTPSQQRVRQHYEDDDDADGDEDEDNVEGSSDLEGRLAL
ncbi:hypothetical protein HDU67_009580 [Dinochytrium kinnereticum]|nr:hypothetical protein HDU67_009580 [Dinochytrium kinnereticum]